MPVLKTLFQRFFLPLLVLIAAFLRLYNLPHSLMFQGDQGRDALIVSQIFTKGDLVFIGPVTSVGNMYLGPLYYYFMLPFLALSYPSPVGPVYAIAVLGIATVYLLYRWGKNLVGERAALIAAFLMTFSVSSVFYSRFSWNPNPAPLVGLGMIYATYLAWKKHPWYWAVVALCFSILIQLHYLTLLSAAGAGLIWLIHVRDLMSAKNKSTSPQTFKNLLIGMFAGLIIFAVSLAPLMLFDYKHEWLNARAFQKLFTQEEAFTEGDSNTFVTKLPKTIKETHGRSMHILFEHTIGKQRNLNTALLLITLIIGALLLTKKNNPYREGQVVIAAYLLTGIMGTATYEHTVFDHYIAYLFPVGFLTLGAVLSWLTQKTLGKIAAAVFIVFYLIYNLPRMPLATSNWSIFDMQRVSNSIYQKLRPGEQYALVLLSPSKDIHGQNYRYFLSTTDNPPQPMDKIGEVNTLVVINEDHHQDVGSLPIYEIVVFPNKQPDERYTIDGGPEIIIYRKK